MDRPLLRGFILGDAELLGKLARSGGAREDRHQLISRTYFELLAEHRLLHPDLSPESAAHAFLATFEGFLRAESSVGEPTADPQRRADLRRRTDLQRRADLLAVTVQRAFETGRKLSPATQSLLGQRVIDLLQGLIDADQADPAGDA
jgi:hypothetical protein